MSTTTAHSPVRYEDKETGQGEGGHHNALNKILSLSEIDSPYFLSSSGEPQKRSKIPAWLDHFKAKDLKTLFKCSLAVWIATLLIFINATLDNYGTATFFGPIALFIVPPSGIVFVHTLGALTMVIGMCLGWAWGAITLKAALATRSIAETNARLAQLAAAAQGSISNAGQSTGQTEYTEVLIYDGFMLDSRITATIFCMLGLFIYLVARLRVAAPKLALLQVFAIVVADIFLTIAPLLPSFEGTIPDVLVKPAVTAMAIGIACNMLFFPQSTSYITLESVENLLAPMKGLLDACFVKFERPEARFNLGQLQAIRASTIGAKKGLDGCFDFLTLDCSTGRWNTDDLITLKGPVNQIVIAFLAFLQFQIHRIEIKSKITKLDTYGDALRDENKELRSELPVYGHHQLAHALDTRRLLQTKEDLLEKSTAALLGSSEALIRTCGEAIESVLEAVRQVNTRRWFRKTSVQECQDLRARHEEILQKLKVEKHRFATLTTDHLLDPHSHLFDEKGNLLQDKANPNPVHALMLGIIFEERLLDVAEAWEILLSRVVELERHRTKTRVWLPSGLQHFIEYAFGRKTTPGMAPTGDTPEIEDAPKRHREGKGRTRKEEKLRMETQFITSFTRGGRSRSTFSKLLLGMLRWFSNTEGMYALRMLILSMALASPAVIPATAGFFFREKALWALIMSQTGLKAYAADFLEGFILRLIGTVLGDVTGMVCWYIGAGDGPGNPYGMAAIMAVAIVCLMWARLFAPPAFLQGVMIMGATTYLVVGYSWDDTHAPSYGNPGTGYSVFWRRTLLVIVGSTAAAIVTFFPRPPSASRHCRKVLSQSIRMEKDLYGLLIRSWKSPRDDLKALAEKHGMMNAETLNGIAGPIRILKLEFSKSNFDSATLSHVLTLSVTINESLTQLLMYSVALPEELKTRFSKFTGAFDERLVGDVMAVLTLIEQALKTGDPLPAILPAPLVARSIDIARNLSSDADWERHALNLRTIRGENFRKYAVMLSAFMQMLGAIDEMVFTVKGAVGESQSVDLEDAVFLDQ